MNRASLIECVDRHLQSLASRHGQLPLGEVVPHIATEIRRGVDTRGIPVNIIPLQVVSAFVDGNATDEETRSVCQAVLVDNSVLAEVIAAVRAAELVPELLPALEPALADRLLAMVPMGPNLSANGTDQSKQQNRLNGYSLAHASGNQTLIPPLIHSNTESNTESNIQTTVKIEGPAAQPSRYSLAAAIVLALAASVLILVWLQSGRPNPSEPPQLVDSHETDSNHIAQLPDGTGHEPEPSDSIESSPQITRAQVDLPPPKIDDALVVSPKAEKPPMESANSMKPPESPIRNSPPIPEVASLPLPLKMADIQWTKINGLLARRLGSTGLGSTNSLSPGELPNWSGVESGSHDFEKDQSEVEVHLVSLPGSRAESEFATGGKLVVASDTGLSLKRTGNAESMTGINIEHGAFALVDLPARSGVELSYNGISLWKIVWTTQASIAIASTPMGVQVQIDGGDIEIDGQVRRDVSLLLNQGDIKEVSNRNHRLPNWVSRQTETVPMPRTVLSQLASSENLGNALDRLVAMYAKSNLPIDSARLEIMAGWRASLADDQLVQFASSDVAAMRQATFQRLVQLPEWDPRVAKIWRRMESTFGDPNTAIQTRAMVEFVRRGTQPNADQIDQLIAGLDSPEFGRRALSDFLLRRFFGGGPAFDPGWTGQAHTRGIGLWRRYINAARPN